MLMSFWAAVLAIAFVSNTFHISFCQLTKEYSAIWFKNCLAKRTFCGGRERLRQALLFLVENRFSGVRREFQDVTSVVIGFSFRNIFSIFDVMLQTMELSSQNVKGFFSALLMATK